MGVGIEGEEGLCDLDRARPLVVAVAAHLPLAVAAGAMGVDGQPISRKIAGCATDLPQGNLQPLRVCHRMFCEQAVNRHVVGDERQAVGQLESPLARGGSGGTEGLK
jgi:hypothetical protein